MNLVEIIDDKQLKPREKTELLSKQLLEGNASIDQMITLAFCAKDSGTVVRWSAAFALGQIIKLNTLRNKELIPAAEIIINREEKNSIKKIYTEAIKKSNFP